VDDSGGQRKGSGDIPLGTHSRVGRLLEAEEKGRQPHGLEETVREFWTRRWRFESGKSVVDECTEL
jgi:hypothetical protein